MWRWSRYKLAVTRKVSSRWIMYSMVPIYIHVCVYICVCVYIYIYIYLGPHLRHVEVPRLGVKSKLFLPASVGVSATYTTAHSNVRSLTHGVRPGIKPASTWILVRFTSVTPQWELPRSPFLFWCIEVFLCLEVDCYLVILIGICCASLVYI